MKSQTSNFPIKPNSITFGKYKGLELENMLKDRKYCEWFVSQPELVSKYEYISNSIKAFLSDNPFNISKQNFEPGISPEIFIKNYCFFHLPKTNELKINLSNDDKKCYLFYKNVLRQLRKQIENTIVEPYNIKTPRSWLQNFEKETGLSRDILKEFLSIHNLPNITTVIEEIKRLGGIEYKGAQSFKIAKSNSEAQEKFWETILKKYYGDEITVQHKFENCFFDFLNSKKQTLYECKLGLKDFNSEQYNKYVLALNNSFDMIYLIGNDCIVCLKNKKIYTTEPTKYTLYFITTKNKTKLDAIIEKFEIVNLEKIEKFFEMN